ncbi:hypothetical protein KIW84_040244 [Lathyrus oleraceus]|uniref:Retrotransposon gag domain-containing protein n=1 Tax=Pisum sativum TaxID=3888 RepID=A0A9D4X6J9_PEA|nr:hypothetical protein KIW84_UN0895 [Pisum sativum]KAI5414693.1 hypothetical protein KIW84_040244 [Pisum sativum]
MITEGSYGITDVSGSSYSSDSLQDSSYTVPENSEKCIRIEMHWLPFVMESKGEMSENAAVTDYPNSSSRLLTENAAVTDYPIGSNRLLVEKKQQQLFEISDSEASDTVVPAPTVVQNDVVNNGRPVRQRALPHRLRDYERFQDKEVNNDGDFVHFTLMAESEPINAHCLISKKKENFIDGTLRKPLVADLLYAPWICCNNMVLAWFYRPISESIAKSVLWIDNAACVWHNLHILFSHSDIFCISDIQEDLYKLRQGTLDVSNYFTQLKVLWDELDNYRPVLGCSCAIFCSCGVIAFVQKYREQDCVICFLKGLNENFTHFKS